MSFKDERETEEDSIENQEIEQEEEFEEDQVEAEEHHDCTEYKSKIWDKAFSDPMAMRLAEVTFDTVKEMTSDVTCLDNIRSFIRFVEVLSTNPNSHYTAKMLHKLIASSLKRLEPDSADFKETRRVINRIINEKPIQDLIISFLNNSIDLLKDANVRDRLITMVEEIGPMLLPSENELFIKEKIKKFKGIVSSPINKFRSAVGTILRELDN